jgi:fructose-1,6-bisphosphatase/inositol monophosphatase family enzyme
MHSSEAISAFDPQSLAELEHCALRLARAAGARIIAAIAHGGFAVEFKEPRAGSAANSNPVSEIDREVERLIRAELAAACPGHAVIGEELGAGVGGELSWAVDPVDGTTNFVNGLPLVASSIGVLYRGRPLAGAIWCACTHALHPASTTPDPAARFASTGSRSHAAALMLHEGQWIALEEFGDAPAEWCRPMLIGDEQALQAAVKLVPPMAPVAQ